MPSLRTALVSAVSGAALVVLFASSTGCAHTGALVDQASWDMQCPRDQVDVGSGGKERDVRGCGKIASYRWTGSRWVLIDRTQPLVTVVPRQPGPPAAPPAAPGAQPQ